MSFTCHPLFQREVFQVGLFSRHIEGKKRSKMIKIRNNQPEIQDTPCVLFPCGERGSKVVKTSVV